MSQPLYKNALAGVLSLEAYTPGMPIDELQRKLGVSDAVKLSSNENPLGMSPRVREAVAAAVAGTDLARYPDGSGFRLKRKLAVVHDIATERITLGNGSNDIIELLGRVYLGPGRKAMFSAHAFAVYSIIAQAQDAEAVVVPARPLSDTMPLGHDLDAFASRLKDDVSLVFIANPNNPTGTWLEPGEIEAFMRKVPTDVIVALDEAYNEYMDPALRCDSRALLEQFPNLVVFRTFSKAYGLAGLRAGYALSSAGMADLLNRVRQPFNNNSLALLAAEVALEDQEHVNRSVALNLRERSRLAAALAAMGLQVLPSQANFLAIGFNRDAGPVHQALLARGIIVRPVASYDMPQFLRVSIGTESENDRFLAALHDILKT
ncbi:MAG TPA: histidinol-phosphate transaminase [Stenotrophobium sp.]|nr:histidinol-phosphate transaminase [Stenotrophobium sp.]